MPQRHTGEKSTFIHVITWFRVGPDLCSHMASLGHNELINYRVEDVVSRFAPDDSYTKIFLSALFPTSCDYPANT